MASNAPSSDSRGTLVLDLSNETSSDSRGTLLLDLEDLENQVSFAVGEGGAMIYWNHQLSKFNYLIPQDNAQYKQEIKNMRKHFREGMIIDVKAGKEFQINGSALYPLDMKMRDLPCHAYMLLRRNGLFEDTEYTPYFFKSKTTRDEVLEWMQRSPATA